MQLRVWKQVVRESTKDFKKIGFGEGFGIGIVVIQILYTALCHTDAYMWSGKFDGREATDRVASPGTSAELVWTTFGGEVQFVEATTMVDKGELHLTGQLGELIKESAQIALTWVTDHI
ncbi:hypothetical protein VNO80_30700 [Phaseolus coccineus]|uniref:Lon proteolytic domain-containing protein n=1 Tax=Phaseolus coccineus TaxID=3886 RepID=A0AAN9QG17_PHACN